MKNPKPRKYVIAEKRRLREKRQALMMTIGASCAKCGSLESLEFDHPYGREYQPREIARTKRLRLYREDYEAGNLRVLCSHCNKIFLPETEF